MQALAEAGAPIIQVNDPVIVFNKDDIDIFSRALTRMLNGVQAETAVYTWFGSAAGILPALLDLPVATIGLDFVSGRDNWEAVKSVRFDKKLGAGIVDGRNTRIESIEQIEESIRRLSQSVTPDRIYVNPSCGLEYLPRETAFEKLKRMVDGARKAEPVAA